MLYSIAMLVTTFSHSLEDCCAVVTCCSVIASLPTKQMHRSETKWAGLVGGCACVDSFPLTAFGLGTRLCVNV